MNTIDMDMDVNVADAISDLALSFASRLANVLKMES